MLGMFKKLKQRIEEGDPQPLKQNVLASTPKKNSRPPSVRSYIKQQNSDFNASNLRRENKWEKRRRSTASLYSSRESLLSIDSTATATVSRNSCGESFCSAETPVDSPFIFGTFRDAASKEEVLSELGKKNEKVKKLESKINEMASAFTEQTRQRDRLEEALQNLQNEMRNRTESTINDSLQSLRAEYEQKLVIKDRQVKEHIQKQQEESNRFSNVKELNVLQQGEVDKLKAMLIHSQTEMSRKTAELFEKSKQIENLDKQYMEQRLELEGLEERLDEISKDRSKYEIEREKLSTKITTLDKEKVTLKSQLTQKSSMLETVQLTADRAHEEATSLRQTYQLYKAKTSSDINEKDSEITMLKERVDDLQQRLQDCKLSENDQVKALEKERSLLEGRLHDTREQLAQTNDKISTYGSLVTTLDEKLTKKNEVLENLQNDHKVLNKNYEVKINDLQEKLTAAEKVVHNFESVSSQSITLQSKIKELEKKVCTLKTEKMEMEILADKSSFLDAQNKLLEIRFKETVDRLETDRRSLEEKVRELQTETRKSSFRQEHTTRRKFDQLETKVEEQNRLIEQYQERLEELVEEKENLYDDLSVKEEECKKASACLEGALTEANELKGEITQFQAALKEKNELITMIKENSEASATENTSIDSLLKEELASVREMFDNREQDLIERDETIEELQHVIRDKNDELATVSRQLHEFQENNRMVSPRNKTKSISSSEKELQKTVLRLTTKTQELERQVKSGQEVEVENRSLKAEVEEANQKIQKLQQSITDLRKNYQRDMKNSDTGQQQMKNERKKENLYLNISPGFHSPPSKSENENRDYLEVNFKYLKHVILKYMCSTNEQSRQLVGVIGHLLQFTTRESSIVRDCFEWKLPLEKKR